MWSMVSTNPRTHVTQGQWIPKVAIGRLQIGNPQRNQMATLTQQHREMRRFQFQLAICQIVHYGYYGEI